MAGRFSVEAVFKAVDRVTAPVSRMQTRISKFTRGAARGLRSIDRAAGKLTGGLKRIGTALLGLGGTAVAGAAITNTLTAADVRSQQLSASIGANVNDMDALTASVSGAGFEFDHVMDLIEEMNNKLGESSGLEATTPVLESLEILGLNYEKIKKLAPEEQFKTIADAALQMEDAQKAAAAADILMGGEANKLIGVLRQQGGSIDEIVGKYQSLNVRTEESRKGAAAFQEQMRTASFAVSSITSEVAGLTGQALAPLLGRLTDWMRANKELVKTRLSDFVGNLNDGLNWLILNFEDVVKWTKRIGVGLAVFVGFIAILKTLITVMTAVNLVMALNPITLLVLGVVALVAALVALGFYLWSIRDKLLDLGRAVVDKVIAGVTWLKDTFLDLPGPVQAAVALLTGPIGMLAFASTLITENWEGIKTFFADLWGGVVETFDASVGRIMALVDKVKGAADKISSMAGGAVDKAKDAADQVGNALSNAGSNVAGFFGFGDDEDEQQSGGNGGSQVVSPQERTARSIEESRSTSTAEVTIRDETGRAEVTGGRPPAGVSLQPTGGF